MFERSRVPLTLVNRDGLIVAINDAALELLHYDRDQVIGTSDAISVVDDDPTLGDRLRERLLRTNELYAEHVVAHGSGKPMRVSYAGHGTSIGDRWIALFVTLSARFEPDGAELIGTNEYDGSGPGSQLTAREREVVRRVALGDGTRRIAADLYLSPATVRTHVHNAMVKTNAHTRAQLVAIVLGDGLIGE